MQTATSIQATTEHQDISRSTLTWIVTAATVGLMIFLFADVLADLASEWWTQEEASYGMLVPPMALYIAWLQRKKTLAFEAQPALRGLWLLGFGCLVLMSGKLAGEFFLARISFVFVLAGLAWTFWGGDRLKTLAFPFVLLATMVPLPVLVFTRLPHPYNCSHLASPPTWRRCWEFRFIGTGTSSIWPRLP